MRFFVVATILLTVCFANAQLVDGKIILDKELSRSVSPTSDLKLGVYSLGFLNSTCTGTLISKEGHVLVARHCVEPSIAWGELRWDQAQLKVLAPKYEGWASMPSLIPESERPPLQSFWKEEKFEEDPKTRRAPLTVITYHQRLISNNLHFHLGLDNERVLARVVAVGPGELWPRFAEQLKKKDLKEIHHKKSDNGFSDGGDFAIVEIPTLKNAPCLRLSTTPPKVKDFVHAMTFGCYKDMEEKEWPKNRAGAISAVADAQGRMTRFGFYLPRGNFVVSTNAIDCNSGSAVLDGNDHIVGVLHAVVDDTKEPVSIALSTKRILELMNPKTRERILKLNEQCK